MTDIRLICFDIDGTLVHDQGSVFPDVIEEVRRVRDLGVSICFATGRASFSTRYIAEILDIDSPSLVSSGSLIMKPLSGEVLLAKPIEPAMLVKICDELRANRIYTELYTAHDYFVEWTGEFTPLHASYMRFDPKTTPFTDELYGKQIVKIVTMSHRDSPEELRSREILDRYPELALAVSTGHAHPNILFFNVTAAGASREHGFQYLVNHYGVTPEQVAAFGDSDSDVPFLKLAGHGVAMGNASPTVQAAARYVAAPVERSGVAQMLREFFPSR